MVEYMTAAVKENPKQDQKGRNLLSVAYKNVVGARRAAWRMLDQIAQSEARKGNAGQEAMCNDYKKKVEGELESICGKLNALLQDTLIPTAAEEGADALVFYWKMKGDYHRYVAEFAEGETRDGAKGEATKAYEKALATATADKDGLAATHPIRLGLALNFSVFHYEINEKKEDACQMAKDAFDSAIAELDSLDEDSYKDATLIMQLLRDNLTLWTSEEDGGADN